MKEKIFFSFLKGMARLPLPMLYILADFISLILQYVARYRKKVVVRNLRSAFPDKSDKELRNIKRDFYHFLGDQIVETLKLLHISDKELKRRVKITNYDAVNNTLREGRNAVLLMGHYCNWEWVQEITRDFIPDTFMTSIYHPLHNKTWDEFFIKIRSRWNAHIVPMKKAPRILLSKGNMPWVCGFIADARTYDRHENNWVNFLNHKTWFIYGPEEIGQKVNADFFYLEMVKKKRGYYDINFHSLHPQDLTISYPHTRLFWQEFEKTINRAPAYWLWSHRRWKSL